MAKEISKKERIMPVVVTHIGMKVMKGDMK